jgi:hypothetical protein
MPRCRNLILCPVVAPAREDGQQRLPLTGASSVLFESCQPVRAGQLRECVNSVVMRLLDISTDLGPGATLSQLEVIVKGLRVAADVAHDAETARVRRAATERMKFPTEEELRNLLDRLPDVGDETSPRYRARRLLQTLNGWHYGDSGLRSRPV